MKDEATVDDLETHRRSWERAMRLPPGSLTPMTAEEIAARNIDKPASILQRYTENAQDTAPLDTSLVDWDDVPDYTVEEVLGLPPPK